MQKPKRKGRDSRKTKQESNAVYFFWHPLGYIKIGMTRSGRVHQRFQDVQSGTPFRLVRVAMFPCKDARKEERKYQAMLKPRHVRGEWFAISRTELGQLLKYLEADYDVGTLQEIQWERMDEDVGPETNGWQYRRVEALHG